MYIEQNNPQWAHPATLAAIRSAISTAPEPADWRISWWANPAEGHNAPGAGRASVTAYPPARPGEEPDTDVAGSRIAFGSFEVLPAGWSANAGIPIRVNGPYGRLNPSPRPLAPGSGPSTSGRFGFPPWLGEVADALRRRLT